MRLVEHLPERHRDTEVGLFQEGAEPAVEALRAAVEDFLAQLSPSTATWGLEHWERALGQSTDLAKELAHRRSSVVAKIRSGGPITVAALQNIAESFSGGAVDIAEYPNEHRLEISFTGTFGIPKDLEHLTAAIDEVLPAHLTYGYILTLRSWGVVAKYTWGDLGAHTWNDVKEGSL